MFTIIHREEMANGSIILHEILAPAIAKKALPGQFVILRVGQDGERIPLTMANSNLEKGTITIVFQIVGKSTQEFNLLKIGDNYTDIVGPLGNPTHIEKLGTVVCVGGGTGVAVLHPITRAMKQAGNRVIAIIGARSKELIILEDEMKKASDELIICTDDGSYGRKGFVSDPLKEILAKSTINQAVVIGPVPMMKFVCSITKPYNIHTLVSLNPIMVDGTGMCGCCRVTIDNEIKFGCVDGPEFNGHLVDFDELSMRLKSYINEEQIAREHSCRLFGVKE